MDAIVVQQRSDYTFKSNRKLGRHGWLRLTPAYSVKLVTEILENSPNNSFILDPFSGTATTGLVSAERGLNSNLFEINPFLIWLGNSKLQNYTKKQIETVSNDISVAIQNLPNYLGKNNWVPAIHNIERWWCNQTLKVLAALRASLIRILGEPQDINVNSLAWVAFCRLIIETSSAAFNHISMSFKDNVITFESEQITELYLEIFSVISESAKSTTLGNAVVIHNDARNPNGIEEKIYTHVVTSPPYPNRISYIRELRPYMYWMGFINEAREAGELDWEAIGGTWGIATSRLANWKPDISDMPNSLLNVVHEIRESGNKNSHLMSQYVYKYFHDMHIHFDNLRKLLKNNAKLFYIVGNSTFYGVQVHSEILYEESLRMLGYKNISHKIVRKRNCKKELFEYCVSATWNI